MYIFFLLLIKTVTIIALIKIALIFSDHWIPAGIYAVLLFLGGLFTGASFGSALISAGIGFALAALYFSGFLFLIILIVGLVIVFF
jgi:hypothetical protein